MLTDYSYFHTVFNTQSLRYINITLINSSELVNDRL